MTTQIIPVDMDSLIDEAIIANNGDITINKEMVEFDITDHILCRIKLHKIGAEIPRWSYGRGFKTFNISTSFEHHCGKDNLWYVFDVSCSVGIELMVYGYTMSNIRAAICIPIAAIFPVYADHMVVNGEMSWSDKISIIYVKVAKEMTDTRRRLDAMVKFANGEDTKEHGPLRDNTTLSLADDLCKTCLRDMYALGNRSCAQFL